MNFFQLQNKLFYSKKTEAGELDTEGEQAFVPFLFNRWLSFYNNDMAVFTNDTLNRFSSIFEDKQDTYNFYYYFIPSLKWKKITYIKKKKKEEADALENLNLVAKNKNSRWQWTNCWRHESRLRLTNAAIHHFCQRWSILLRRADGLPVRQWRNIIPPAW